MESDDFILTLTRVIPPVVDQPAPIEVPAVVKATWPQVAQVAIVAEPTVVKSYRKPPTRTLSSTPDQLDFDVSFRFYGACLGADPEIFFHTNKSAVEDAKSFCNRCPVRVECLQFAETIDPISGLPMATAGVYGGTTQAERAARRRHRYKMAS